MSIKLLFSLWTLLFAFCALAQTPLRISDYDSKLQALKSPDLPQPLSLAYLQLSPEGQSFLKSLQGEALRLGEKQQDRYGQIIAPLFLGQDELQSLLLRQGWAALKLWPFMKKNWLRWLEAENLAREKRLGFWQSDSPFIHKADQLEAEPWPALMTYAWVVGQAQELSCFTKNCYLNFGEDYQRDFTLVFSKGKRKALAKSLGLQDSSSQNSSSQDALLQALLNKRLLVRGVITLKNGPSIELQEKEQLLLWPVPGF